jgi:hypothetical protein
MASGFPLDIVGDGEDEFLDLAFLDTVSQGFEIQLVGPDTPNRGKLAMQNMVTTMVGAGTLDGKEVGHTLNDTYFPVFAFLSEANGTGFILGEVSADGTGSYRGSRNPQSLDELIETLGFLHQKV